MNHHVPPPGSRIVVCSAGIPHLHTFKGLSASMMTLYGYLDHLKKSGYTILHVLLLEEAAVKQDLLDSYRKEMEKPGVFEVLIWRMERIWQPRKRSYHPHVMTIAPQEIIDGIRAFRPDALFFLDVYSAGPIIHHHIAPALVQVHDPKFQTLWYHSLYSLRETPWKILDVLAEWVKCKLWKDFYRDVLKNAARVITVAKSSERELASIGIPAHYVPMAWPDARKENHPQSPNLPAKPTFLFLGNLSGLGSRSALHFLLEQVYPKLVALWGQNGFIIHICGAHTLPPWVAEKIKPMPEMHFMGFVDDLESLMLTCHAALAPIDVKVGNRTRILTAMSLGVPTVNHTHTALGNPALIDGETCYLATDPAVFAERMKRTVERGPEVETIIKNARMVFETQFESKAATDALQRELAAMLAETAAASR